MKVSLLVGFTLILLATTTASVRAQVSDIWNIQLASNRQAQTTVGVINRCTGAHEFELSADPSMSWFSFVAAPRVLVGQGQTTDVAARINTNGLDVGVYEGRILVRCADCGLTSTCQTATITARLKVLWATDELERLQSDLFLARQLLVVLQIADANQIDRIVSAFETRHRLRRLKVFTLASITRTTVLFELVDPSDSVIPAVARLQDETGVIHAQPNFRYQTQAVKTVADKAYNDPLAGLQYGARQMKAEQLHKLSTGRGIQVALIDTGVDYRHVELKGRVIDRVNFVDGDGDFAEDVHGTLVAGVIAARPNNATGIYGIAPGVSLIAIKSFRPRQRSSAEAEGSSQTLAQGLDYAITRGARVINLSIGGPREPLISQLVRAAFARGVVLIAAAGNEGSAGLPRYPAAFDQVLAVTAIDSRDGIYPLATRGDYLGVAAPGVEVISTIPDNKFNAFSGTSMAAPHVSGLVALLLQGNPRLSPSAIKAILKDTARDLGAPGWDRDFGSGVLDACRAFERATGRRNIC